jgi:tetratricopeptide (TPR) repeat protein
MRFVSTMALGLMLAVGGGAVVGVSPAVAAKKEKAPKQNLTKEFMAPASEMQKAITAKDFATAQTKLTVAEAAAKTPDDLYTLNLLRLQLGLGLGDAAVQRKGIEGMLASGATPAAEVGKYHFYAGDFALKANDSDAGIAHLEKAIGAGYPGSTPHVLLAEAYFKKAVADAKGNQLTPAGKAAVQAGLPHLKHGVDIEKGEGKAVPAGWYERGFQLAYVAGLPQASEWALYSVEADPNAKNWRSLLRGYQDTHRALTKSENLDLMRLMRTTGALESEYDYSEYAEAAVSSGLPGEAKAVIDEGRSKGKIGASKLSEVYQIANSRVAADKASLPSGEKDAAKAANGKIASSTADAYLGYGDYAKAATLYRLALQKGSVDANEINTRLGIALAKSGDAAGAKAAFDQVAAGSRKDIANFWILWLSKQQG